MDIEEFRRKGRIIQERTTEEITEEYRILITEYRKKYFYQIIETIQSYLRGIPEYRIEEWIEEYLISEMKSEGYRQFNKMHDSLETEFDSMYRSFSSNRNIPRNIELYEESLNAIVRRTTPEWLEDLSTEFIQQITRKIEYYNMSFLGIDDRTLYRNIENISFELKGTLRRINNQFQEEYAQMIKSEIKKNTREIENNMHSIKINNQEIPQEYISNIQRILNYQGYRLIKHNDKTYIQDKTTQEMFEVTYDSNYNVIKTTNGNLGIKIQGDSTTIVDINKNNMMSRDMINFEMSNSKRQFRIKITQGFVGYEFEYGNKKITDLAQISAIIDSIKTKVPSYYEELLKDKDFQQLSSKLDQYEKDHQEIYVDKTDNRVKVNPQTKETVAFKLRLFGYDLQEKEDGLYAINLKTQEEHKIKAFSNGFGFEDKKAYELNFNTDLTIRTPDVIIPNHIEFHQGQNNLFVDRNLTRFNVFIGNTAYKIEITDKGIIATARDKDNQLLFMSDTEILNAIKVVFPYVEEYIQSKTNKQNKAEQTFNGLTNQQEISSVTLKRR